LAATFYLVYDANSLPEGIDKTLKTIIHDAGKRMGLLDFRPQHMGWFGTFRIKSFTVLDGEQNPVEETPITTKRTKKARVE
jgi:hypothetical protein